MPDPNQNNSNNQAQGAVPTIPSFNDAPPLPPDFQNVPSDPLAVSSDNNKTPLVPPVVLPTTPEPTLPTPSDSSSPLGGSGSAAPSDLPPVITPPKKKFGGGRVIATILGLFLLVGGIGAGIVLTSQQQLFEQKASGGVTYCTTTDAVNGYCTPPPGGGRGCLDTGCNSTQYCHCQGGQPCNYGVCVPKDYFDTACTGDGRVVCNNSGNPQAKTCCAAGYVCGGSGGCVPGNPPGSNGSNPPSTGTPRPTGTPNPTASCQNVKAYSSTWVLLSANDLSHLARGTAINFCVTGTTTAGSFDKARFTINGVGPTETTTRRPGNNDYCTAYTIPATGTTFNITADIHHVSLGWK